MEAAPFYLISMLALHIADDLLHVLWEPVPDLLPVDVLGRDGNNSDKVLCGHLLVCAFIAGIVLVDELAEPVIPGQRFDIARWPARTRPGEEEDGGELAGCVVWDVDAVRVCVRDVASAMTLSWTEESRTDSMCPGRYRKSVQRVQAVL